MTVSYENEAIDFKSIGSQLLLATVVVFTEADTNRLTNRKNLSTDLTDTLNQNPNGSIRN